MYKMMRWPRTTAQNHHNGSFGRLQNGFSMAMAIPRCVNLPVFERALQTCRAAVKETQLCQIPNFIHSGMYNVEFHGHCLPDTN